MVNMKRARLGLVGISLLTLALGVVLFGVSTDWNWGLLAALFLLQWSNNLSVHLANTR